MTTRVLCMSTPEFGIPTLRLLAEDDRFDLVGVVTQPDKPAGRGLKLTPPPIKVAALKLGLQVLQPASLRTSEALAAIKALRPDLIAVAAYGQWIPESVFNLPPKRSLNLHPSLLPLHRGAAPVVSAILAGDDQVGLSVLFVEDEMDAGDLLSQMSVPIEEDDTTGVVMAKLAQVDAPFFVDTIADWAAGKITPQPQDHALATWIDRLKKEDGLIDWTWSAAKIARRCRALSPWPGTCTFFEGRRLLIHRATPIPLAAASESVAEPGSVLRLDSEVAIVTGDGGLRLNVIQLAGQRPLAIDDFVRGQRTFIGTRLG